MSKKVAAQKNKLKTPVNIPVDWRIPDDMLGKYATNILVQANENEFVIYFFEISPPILLGSPEEQQAKIERLESIKASCLSKIIVSPQRLPEFVKVLQDQIDRQSKIKKSPTK